MYWPQRMKKMLSAGFWFWGSKERNKEEHNCETKVADPTLKESETKVADPTLKERLRSRYQLYKVSSDLSHVKIKAENKFPILMPTVFQVTLKNDLLWQNDNKSTTDLAQISAALKAIKENDVEKRMIGESFHYESIMHHEYKDLCWLVDNMMHSMLEYDFVVKTTDLKDLEKYELDLSLIILQHIEGRRFYLKEIRPLSLQTLMKTDTISFTVFGKEQKFEYDLQTSINSDTDVKLRNIDELCRKEEDFITKRKTVVFKNMRGLYKELREETDAPNIAIIGSGGGIRALVCMCGAMSAMQKHGILDWTMFTAGLSGSAWYLLKLFATDTQHDPKAFDKILREKLEKSNYLQFRSDDNLYDYITQHLLPEKETLLHNWCEQTSKLADGSIPLPLIAALHVRSEKTIGNYYEWLELSPYEFYIPKYGTAIDMKNFGYRFYGGFALNEHIPFSFRIVKEWNKLKKDNHAVATEKMAVGGKFRDNLKQFTEMKYNIYWSSIKDRKGAIYDVFDTTFIGRVQNMIRGMKELKPCFDDLDSKSDHIDLEKEDMMLVDSGTAFNSPYPVVLHPSRKVDVIISFDFSEREEDTSLPFEELEKAEKWANNRNVPFPNLNPKLEKMKEDWKRGIYKEVYVFEGDNSPTIVHFVLINKLPLNASKKDNLKIFPKYGSQKYCYSGQDFDELTFLFQRIVRENTEMIQKCIFGVIDRKQNKQQNMEERKE